MATELDKALKKIAEEVVAGVRHGHFKMHIECNVTQNGVRRVILDCGKGYKFDIPERDIDRAA